MAKKTAAFVCSTFRRPSLLEWAVGCFLAQEWDGKKIMVIINDEPNQTLVFDHPDVRIFNRKERLPLAAKLNVAVSECIEEADYLFHADDDDLFAPERCRVSVENMAGGVFKTDRFWIDTKPIKLVAGRNLGNYAFTPRVWARYGGYRSHHGTPWYDINLMNHFDFYMNYHGHKCRQPKRPFMLYRKNIQGHMNLSRVRVGGDHRHIVYENRLEAEFESGRVELEPKFTAVWDFRDSMEAVSTTKIHLVDPTYSDVDLSTFYKGIER